MQWLKNIQRTDWLLIGIYYGLALLIEVPAILLNEELPFFGPEGIYVFGFKSADYLLDILVEIIMVFFIFYRYFFQKKYYTAFFLALLLLAAQVFIQPIILSNGYQAQLPINLGLFLDQLADNVQAITGVCFILIAKQFYESKSQIMELQKEKKESELRWLKSQIDPHFLFNNLNILDILINTDPKKASTYTKRLSSLYRYMIRHKDEDVVSLAEEWNFSQDYIYLLQQRFDELFIFKFDLAFAKLHNYYIPPASMQTLLENIVKHNVALPDEPITTEIYLEDDCLIIKNELRKKLNVKDSTGTGLDNLRKRIKILTDQEMQVEQGSDYFLVKVPLVKEID